MRRKFKLMIDLFMNKFFEKDSIARLTSVISIFSLLITTLVALLAFPKLPPYLPLFNKLPWGYGRLGLKPFIFLPIILSLVIVVINIFLAKYVREKIPLLARFLFIAACVVCLFTSLFILKVIQLTL